MTRFLKSPRHLIAVGVFCLVVLSGLLTVQVVRADGRILPNVRVGGVDLGNLTPEQAKTRLRRTIEALNAQPLSFRYQGRSLDVQANEKTDAPPSQAPISYDVDAMVASAFRIGHNEGTAELLTANVRALFGTIELPVALSADQDALRHLLGLRFSEFETPARDANLRPAATASGSAAPETTPVRFDVITDSTGVTLSYDEAIGEASKRLARWQGGVIELQSTVKTPDVTSADAEAARARFENAMRRGDFTLAYDDQSWTLAAAEVAKAISLKKLGNNVVVTLDHAAVRPLLDDAASKVNTNARPTRMKVENGRAVEFEGGTVGKRLNMDATLARLDEQFESSENGILPIVFDITPSEGSDPVAEQYGIREMLGYGTSNFAGSPSNRRKNIATGVAKLNGIILAPGQEIGLIEYLRPFDAGNGWLPELVIKGNRTVPEYGGGLCQIGTTVFRSVMGSGLPVTQRQNHSFRVRYYEPAGTDATLYDPAPDFKFVNDTQHHAVLIGKIVGDIARFELWGTRDGRVQEQGKVSMLAQMPPPPAKLIETSALAEGEKRCFEKPTAGAITTFTYTITYPDGRVEAEEFRSHYKPWQEQCLVGKAGAPNIVMQKDGALKETPTTSATATPST